MIKVIIFWWVISLSWKFSGRYNFATCSCYNLSNDWRRSRFLFFFGSKSDWCLTTIPWSNRISISSSLLVFWFPIEPVCTKSCLLYLKNIFEMYNFFHLFNFFFRFGLNSLNETVKFWQRNRDTGIPFVR